MSVLNRAKVFTTRSAVRAEVTGDVCFSGIRLFQMLMERAKSDIFQRRHETHGTVLWRSLPCKNAACVPIPTFIYRGVRRRAKSDKEAKAMAVKEKIRVRLKSYDHVLIDTAAKKIVEVATRNGAEVSGPIPLPTEKEIITILRAVHKYKDSREQFEYRTHKRLIDIMKPSQKVVDALMSVELPAGVEIEVKI